MSDNSHFKALWIRQSDGDRCVATGALALMEDLRDLMKRMGSTVWIGGPFNAPPHEQVELWTCDHGTGKDHCASRGSLDQMRKAMPAVKRGDRDVWLLYGDGTKELPDGRILSPEDQLRESGRDDEIEQRSRAMIVQLMAQLQPATRAFVDELPAMYLRMAKRRLSAANTSYLCEAVKVLHDIAKHAQLYAMKFSDLAGQQEISRLIAEKESLQEELTRARPRAHCYDRILEHCGIENDVLGYINQLRHDRGDLHV